MKLKRIVCLFAALLTLSASSAAALADSDAQVVIGPMSWDGRLRADGTSELNVSFSGAPGAYRAYIYAVRDGSAWLKASGRVEIPESGSARAVFRAGFDKPGEFCTLVKVYDYGGALLASRQGLYTDRIFAP